MGEKEVLKRPLGVTVRTNLSGHHSDWPGHSLNFLLALLFVRGGQLNGATWKKCQDKTLLSDVRNAVAFKF